MEGISFVFLLEFMNHPFEFSRGVQSMEEQEIFNSILVSGSASNTAV